MKFKLKVGNIPKYLFFFSELRQYKRMDGAEEIAARYLYPILDVKTSNSAFGALD